MDFIRSARNVITGELVKDTKKMKSCASEGKKETRNMFLLTVKRLMRMFSNGIARNVLIQISEKWNWKNQDCLNRHLKENAKRKSTMKNVDFLDVYIIIQLVLHVLANATTLILITMNEFVIKRMPVITEVKRMAVHSLLPNGNSWSLLQMGNVYHVEWRKS